MAEISFLTITQNIDQPETIQPFYFHKIYDIIYNQDYNGTLAESNLEGWIQVSNAYAQDIDYLSIMYPNLRIDCTGEYYINIDNVSEREFYAKIYGDQTGLTQSRANSFARTVTSTTVTSQYKDKLESLSQYDVFTNLTEINASLFKDFNKLTVVTLPNKVTIIGNDAFRNCTELININILDSVTSIGQYAFDGCTSLEINVDLNNVITIGEHAFRNVPITTTLDTDKLTSIGQYAFEASKINYAILRNPNLTRLYDGVFYNCKNLTRVESQYITTIGRDEFRYCNNLTTCNLPNLTRITGYDAFRDSGITSISFNENFETPIESLGACFAGCINLQSITFNNESPGVTNGFKLSGSFCWGASSLETINLDKCTSVGDQAFYHCSSLKNVGNTSMITSIGNQAFDTCTNLEEIDLSNTTSIGFNTFLGCKKLKSITSTDSIPIISIKGSTFREIGTSDGIKFNPITFDFVTQIDSEAFRDSYRFTKLNFPQLTKLNGARIFESCYDLTEINMPNLTIMTGWGNFINCSKLITVNSPKLTTLNDNNTFYNCTNLNSVDISKVTDIKAETFRYCKHLRNLGNNNVLSVEYIRSHSFRDFGTSGEEGLGEISFPNCRIVEDYAFLDSFGITKINFSSNLSEIRAEAFARCNDVEYITGLDNVAICRRDVFSGCTKLKEISLPNVEQFVDGGSQFRDCQSLINVNLPKLTKLGGGQTFRNCRIVGTLNLPLLEDLVNNETFTSGARVRKINLQSCKKLYGWQFSGDDLLEEIDLSSCETFADRSIFVDCSALKNISLPALTGTIYYQTFRNCTALESITFGTGKLTLNNEAIVNNANLTSINLDNVIYIADYAICENPKLETIGSFSNELTYIGREAFRNDTKLAGNITIPASVETIGYRAFWNCGSITSIIMEATTPPTMNNESFSGALSYPIYVPAGSVDAYKTANNWRNIASRIFAAP